LVSFCAGERRCGRKLIVVLGSRWVIKDGDGKVSATHFDLRNIANCVSGLAPYFKKSQTYDPPKKEHPNKQFMPIAAKDEYHGTDGPIHTSFNDYWEVRLQSKVSSEKQFAYNG
jgi:hypothetical protein